MYRASIKKKILLIILGLFLSVLLGELLFRIGVFLASDETRDDDLNNKNHRILCLGDSTTYGIGASNVNEFSYPSQLQKLFDNIIPNNNYKVINLGKPGINSSQLLNRFEKNVAEYKPDIIIIMVGINDPWNFEESNILDFYNVPAAKQLYMRIELLLNQSKLFRFLKLVFMSSKFNELTVPDFDNKTLSHAVEFYSSDPAKATAFHDAIVNNITKLKEIADHHNVTIIFMKYHNIGWGHPEPIIHHTYEQLGVPVVDNESLFKKATQLGIKVLGNDNWHPNDIGYALIAKSIFNKMVALKILNTDAVDIL
jgi:lysophospholipase L1-like esterase